MSLKIFTFSNLTQILRHKLVFSLILFISSLFFSFLCNSLVSQLNTLGDGIYYMSMYNDEIVKSPWGYRIATPFLASLMPFEPIISFKIITFLSLCFTSIILGLYSDKMRLPFLFSVIFIVFWFFSFAFIYNSTSIVRVDPLMLLLISVIILLSKYRVSNMIILILLCFGIIVHEMVLITIPILWIDKIFGGNLTGGSMYKYKELVFITFLTLCFFLISRTQIEVLPEKVMSYIDTPFQMVNYVLSKSGGVFKHILRIYSSFGPILVFSVFCFLFRKKLNTSIPYIFILLTAVAATFLAVDTLRVMSIIYIPVLFYSVQYLYLIQKLGYEYLTIFCIFSQILFSLLVYMNFATFESSILLNLISASLSILSLLVCCYISYFNFNKDV